MHFTLKQSGGCFVQPDCNEAKADRETAARLVKKRGQLHTTGLSANKRRFTVGDYPEKGADGEEKGKETNKRRFTVGEYPEKGAEGEEKEKETAV